MDRAEVTAAIEQRLAERKKSVLNRNAVAALFAACGDLPVAGSAIEALGQLFLGRHDALDAEKQKISQELVLDLLCKIDDAITALHGGEAAAGVTIAGTIEAIGAGADTTIGVDIQGNQPTTFAPGTIVRAGGTSRSVTGVRVGGGEKP